MARGFHGAAMDEIAVRAGVSKPVLYQHFPGKFELYLALLDEQIDALVQSIRTALAATVDNRARVEGAVSAYFEFVDGDSQAFRLLFESDLLNHPSVRERARAGLADIVEAVASMIMHDTGTSPDRAGLLSAGLTGMAEMSARWWLDRRLAFDRAEAVDLVVALAWRGISAFPAHDEAAATQP